MEITILERKICSVGIKYGEVNVENKCRSNHKRVTSLLCFHLTYPLIHVPQVTVK